MEKGEEVRTGPKALLRPRQLGPRAAVPEEEATTIAVTAAAKVPVMRKTELMRLAGERREIIILGVRLERGFFLGKPMCINLEHNGNNRMIIRIMPGRFSSWLAKKRSLSACLSLCFTC